MPSRSLSVAVALSRDIADLPGNAHAPPGLTLPHVHRDHPCKYQTSAQLAAHLNLCASYAILVHRCNVLPEASFRLRFTTDALALGQHFPLPGVRGTLTPKYVRPCRAHQRFVAHLAMRYA